MLLITVKAIHSWKPISKSQLEDQRHDGRMMLEKIYRSYKCQTGRSLSRIEDERNWFRRPKLCIKSCRAIIIIIIIIIMLLIKN
jgi:hypothetical protein